MIALLFAVLVMAQVDDDFESIWRRRIVTDPPSPPIASTAPVAPIANHVEIDRVCGKRGRYYFMKERRRMWKCYR
jgi:hypothetical protein